jgi:hypothetical protein
VCSYCNTAVFARALDAATYAKLLVGQDQGKAATELRQHQAIEIAQRQAQEQRRRTLALSIAGITAGLVVLLLVIQWARQFSGLQIAFGVFLVLVVVGIIGKVADW